MYRITHNMLIGILFVSSQAMAHSVTDLEACINGQVSATGLFATQEAEDIHRQQQVSTVAQMELEPCINGEVSATGLFVTQEAEDSYWQDRVTGR